MFGGSYDLIAYLFFIKDSSRFLPISPGNFERSLSSIGIDYKLSRKCGWENYTGYIAIIRYVLSTMQTILEGTEVRLIDAHSFLWVINEDENKDYRNWRPCKETEKSIEQETENCLRANADGTPMRFSRMTSQFKRSIEVARITKARAQGKCQLCGQAAPFTDADGNPYLEAHHVIWLCRGGTDSTDNTVALCPNCHTRIHVLDDPRDTARLLAVCK